MIVKDDVIKTEACNELVIRRFGLAQAFEMAKALYVDPGLLFV